MSKVILFYSGGLDTSVCIPMLKEDYGYEKVVTVTVDVGQPRGEIDEAEQKAKKLGALHHTVEAKKEFAEDYILPSIKANGNYQGYPLSTSIARPLIVKKAVEVGKKIGVKDYAHGCTGKGNDQFRIEFGLRALVPKAKIIAPVREKNLTRVEEIRYAQEHKIPISQTRKKIWSIDENLWGRSIEGGRLEETDFAPPEEIYAWTKGWKESPEKPRKLSLQFEEGVPIGINNRRLDRLELIESLNKIAGRQGVGRIDIMEDRILGLKVRENYECPAAVTILTAHQALEALVLTKEELRFKSIVDQQWAELAYSGLWFDPLKDDLEAFINKTQKRVSGKVSLQLYKGGVKVIGRESKWALYSKDLVSFDTRELDQRESAGIVKYHGRQAQMYRKLSAPNGS